MRRNTIVFPCIIYAIVQPVLYSQKDIVQFSDFTTEDLPWEAAQELGLFSTVSSTTDLLWKLEQASCPLWALEEDSWDNLVVEPSLPGLKFCDWSERVAVPWWWLRVRWERRYFPQKLFLVFTGPLPNVTCEGGDGQTYKLELIVGGSLCPSPNLAPVPPIPALLHSNNIW